MNVIIVGCGKLGRMVAKLAIQEKHDIVFIEIDEKKIKKYNKDFDAVFINGDARRKETLMDAGIENVDAIVLTANDSTNLYIARLARSLGVKNIISLVDSEDSYKIFTEDKLLKNDVTLIRSSLSRTAYYIFRNISYPGYIENFIVGEKAEILKVLLSKDSIYVGKPIKKLSLPHGVNIIAIEREREVLIPTPDTILLEGDKITFLARNDKIDALLAKLQEKKKERKGKILAKLKEIRKKNTN